MRLMLAVDLNAPEREATLQEGIRWAERLSASLDLVFVDAHDYSAHLIRDAKIRSLVVEEWRKLQQSYLEELVELSKQIPEAVRGDARYLKGRPRDTLVELSEGYEAVLIATHGRQGLQHFFLGSVAEGVVRRCTVPVIVLRLPSDP